MPASLLSTATDVWQLTLAGYVNCFLVREASGLTLIDTGLPTSAPAILEAAERLGDPIDRVLLTHAHRDHAGGLDALLRRAPGTSLLLTRRAHEALQGRFTSRAGEPDTPVKRWLFSRSEASPDGYLSAGERVGRLRLVAAPGHSPEHVAYFLEDERVLIAGDAFTTRGRRLRLVGRANRAASVAEAVSNLSTRLFTWHPATAARSAERLRSLAPELLLVGHGPPLKRPRAELDALLAATLVGGDQEE